MFTRKFWADAIERAARSCAAAALLVTAKSTVADARVIDWSGVGYYGLGAGAISILMSIAASAKDDPTSASMLK